MRKFKTLCLFFLCCVNLFATDSTQVVLQINIRKEINSTTWLYLRNGLTKAKEIKADAVLLHLNTYGGEVVFADSMRSAILYAPIPVYAFIDNNAASAGALISIACTKIFMRKGANIGAATVVDQTAAALPDKYQSYMRSIMRSTAEARGRNPKIAEAMVDETLSVPMVSDSGKVLTFTAHEALKWGFCDGMAESVDDVLYKQLKLKETQLVHYNPSSVDEAKGFLMSKAIQSLLVMLIIGGIYFELQSPGLGFPSLIAIVGAILYFAPLYIDGLAANWEILLFVLGILAMMAEIFIIPGFGVAGVLGILAIITGLITAMLNNNQFNFDGVSMAKTGEASLTVGIGLLAGMILTLWFSHKIGQKGIFKKIALQTSLENKAAFPDCERLIGKDAKALTILRPSGKIEIENEVYDGIIENGYAEAGTLLIVRGSENGTIQVDKK